MSTTSQQPRVLHEDDPGVNVEILDGFKLMSPRPATPHGIVGGRLYGHFQQRFDRRAGGPPERPGGWILMYEPELRLEGHTLIPDLAGWRRERFALLDRKAAAFRVAPDWVCEVLSDSTELIDRQRKMPLYHRYGVTHVWLVDPLLQTLEIFRSTPDGYLFVGTHGDQDVVHAEPFDAVELPLGEIWPTDEL